MCQTQNNCRKVSHVTVKTINSHLLLNEHLVEFRCPVSVGVHTQERVRSVFVECYWAYACLHVCFLNLCMLLPVCVSMSGWGWNSMTPTFYCLSEPLKREYLIVSIVQRSQPSTPVAVTLRWRCQRVCTRIKQYTLSHTHIDSMWWWAQMTSKVQFIHSLCD